MTTMPTGKVEFNNYSKLKHRRDMGKEQCRFPRASGIA